MAKESLKQKSYNVIKNKILTGQFIPGSFLNEDMLCEELNVSRTPVRDALGRLEQENLITIYPKKGFIVHPLTIGEINMVYEIRLLLEPYVILQYCQNMNEQTLDRMYQLLEDCRKSLDKGNEYLEKVITLDDVFHQIIMDQCDNKYILHMYSSIQDQNSRFRILSGKYDKKRLSDTLDEHFSILEDIQKGELQEASEKMVEHLTKSKQASIMTFIKSGDARY